MKVVVLIFSLMFWTALTLLLTAYGGTINNVQVATSDSYDLNVTSSDVDIIGVSEYTFLDNFITGITGAPIWINVFLAVLFAINIYIIVATFLGVGG